MNQRTVTRTIRRGWRWWSEPFRTRLDRVDGALITHRAFPYLFRVQIVESVEESIRSRGEVVLRAKETVHLARNVEAPSIAIRGAGTLNMRGVSISVGSLYMEANR